MTVDGGWRVFDVVNYGYDAAGRLERVMWKYGDPHQAEAVFGYDAMGRRKRMSIGRGDHWIDTDYSYDAAGRLNVLEAVKRLTGDTVANHIYSPHDGNGNRKKMTTPEGTHDYVYDELDRLTGATFATASVLVEENYSYDAVGNRTTSHLSATHNHDDANRLMWDDKYTYTYDYNGNLETKTDKDTGGVTTYSWDVLDQLIRIDFPGGKVAKYYYDALGRRFAKWVDVGGDGTADKVERYVYDGEDIIKVYNEGSRVIASYLHGPGIDEPLQAYTDEFWGFFVSDGLGSVKKLVNMAGVVRQTYEYDSFGRLLAVRDGDGDLITPDTPGFIHQPFTFTGRERDWESGMYYYRMRYYDAWSGRFIGEDLVDRRSILSSIATTLYQYVLNNPVNSTDPFGLAVINLSDETVIIKPEDPREPITTVPPGGFHPGHVDGVKPPAWNGDWYKVSDYTDIIITPEGEPMKEPGANIPPSPPDFPDFGNKFSDKAPGRKSEPGFSDRNPDWRVPDCGT